MNGPPVDITSLGNLSDGSVHTSTAPPAAYQTVFRLVASFQMLGVSPNPPRPGDAIKRARLDQLASGLGDLSG